MRKNLIVFCLLVIILSTVTYAQSREEYLDCVSKKVFEDCSGTPLQEVKDVIYKKDKKILERNKDNIIYVVTTGISCGGKELTLNSGRYIYGGVPIDCPTILYETKFVLTGKCPIFVVGDDNKISQDCSDKTFDFSVDEFVLFSIGGFSIFGVGVYFFITFIRKSISTRKKRKAEKNI